MEKEELPPAPEPVANPSIISDDNNIDINKATSSLDIPGVTPLTDLMSRHNEVVDIWNRFKRGETREKNVNSGFTPNKNTNTNPAIIKTEEAIKMSNAPISYTEKLDTKEDVVVESNNRVEQKPATGIYSIELAPGLTVKVMHPKGNLQMRAAALLPTSQANNVTLLTMIHAIMYIVEINGKPVVRPRTFDDVLAIADLVEDEGFVILQATLGKLFPPSKEFTDRLTRLGAIENL